MFTKKTDSTAQATQLNLLAKAYKNGADAIFKTLAPNGTSEDFFDVVVLLASTAVSGSGKLAESEVTHNINIFAQRLGESLTEILKQRVAPKHTA